MDHIARPFAFDYYDFNRLTVNSRCFYPCIDGIV